MRLPNVLPRVRSLALAGSFGFGIAASVATSPPNTGAVGVGVAPENSVTDAIESSPLAIDAAGKVIPANLLFHVTDVTALPTFTVTARADDSTGLAADTAGAIAIDVVRGGNPDTAQTLSTEGALVDGELTVTGDVDASCETVPCPVEEALIITIRRIDGGAGTVSVVLGLEADIGPDDADVHVSFASDFESHPIGG